MSTDIEFCHSQPWWPLTQEEKDQLFAACSAGDIDGLRDVLNKFPKKKSKLGKQKIHADVNKIRNEHEVGPAERVHVSCILDENPISGD